MFESVKYAVTRGVELGKTEGVIKGTKMYLNESGQIGAIGMVTALGAVLIGLYVIAIVVGSMGTQITQGNIVLSPRWNTTLSTLDTNAGSAFNIAKRRNCKNKTVKQSLQTVGEYYPNSNRRGRCKRNLVSKLENEAVASPDVNSDRSLCLPVKSDSLLTYQGYDGCFVDRSITGWCGGYRALSGQHNLTQKCLV